jgi:hypothetical protein
VQLKVRAIVEMAKILVVVVASPSETPETLLVVVFVRLQAILNVITVIKKDIMLETVIKSSVIILKHNYTQYNNRLLTNNKPLLILATVMVFLEIPS